MSFKEWLDVRGGQVRAGFAVSGSFFRGFFEDHPERAFSVAVIAGVLLIIGLVSWSVIYPADTVPTKTKKVSDGSHLPVVAVSEEHALAERGSGVMLPATFVMGDDQSGLVRVSVVCEPGTPACYDVATAALVRKLRENDERIRQVADGNLRTSSISCTVEILDQPVDFLKDGQPFRYQMACGHQNGQFASRSLFRSGEEVLSKLRLILQDWRAVSAAKKEV